MKKKISLFILTIIMLITFCSCKLQLKGQVKLLGMNGVVEEKISFNNFKREVKLSNENTISDYQFIVLMNDSVNFDLVIKLENPNDYHIFDFTLECEDENAMVYVNERYQLLSELKSINWQGDTNDEYKISMQVSSEEYITKINLTSMYYSNREDGSNKYDVDLNDKGVVDIYRLYEGIEVNIIDYNTYSLRIIDEHIDTSSIKVNDIEYTTHSNITLLENNNIITYNYILNEENNITKSYSQTYTKGKIFLEYQTYPKVSIKLDSKYFLIETANVKVMEKGTNKVVFEDNIDVLENHYFGDNTDSLELYFLIDDLYIAK